LTAPNSTIWLEANYNETIADPPPPPLKAVNVYIACDTVIFRWQWAWEPLVVQGIDIVEAVYNPKLGHWQIRTDYSEFNGIAFLINAGLFPCKA
jgi:hypothetical protein